MRRLDMCAADVAAKVNHQLGRLDGPTSTGSTVRNIEQVDVVMRSVGYFTSANLHGSRKRRAQTSFCASVC